MPEEATLPFLPGNSYSDVTVPPDLTLENRFQEIALFGPNPKENDNPRISEQDLLQAVGVDPDLVYGPKRYHQKITEPKYVPPHIAFDKMVLRFDGYFKQIVHECREEYHLRKIRILYFLEDDSISVVEPPVENSGIPQGVLIKRQRLATNSGRFYSPKDFNIAQDITFFGKTFRIVSCDKFTEDYMATKVGTKLNPPERMPNDMYQESRTRVARQTAHTEKKKDKLKSFLEKDRMVLRFYCAWDDRASQYGELREFVMHYHLVDDSIEIREVQKPNSGRDPFPILLRRQALPKVHRGLSGVDVEKYTWKDLRIGECINVLGRPFLLRDCDAYTRSFYSDAALKNPSIKPQADEGIPLQIRLPTELNQPLPPYNGYGTVEDSLGSCKFLVPRPPKKDSSKILEDEHKILRFVARLVSKHKEDQERRFVVSYRLSDDTMTIYEPPQRNTGILGGKFMERTRVLRPASSLSAPDGPRYYDITDLYIGTTIEVLCRQFLLIDADEFVYNFMESEPKRFLKSNTPVIMKRMNDLFNSFGQDQRRSFIDKLEKADPERKSFVNRNVFVDIAKSFFSGVTEQELITFARSFEDAPKLVQYTKIFV